MSELSFDSNEAKIGYGIGRQIGDQLRSSDLGELSLTHLFTAIEDALNGAEMRVPGGEPIEFPLNGVIAGWTEGLQLMKEGSKYRLTIPADLAYGANGAGAAIPPFAVLQFDVELIAIV